MYEVLLLFCLQYLHIKGHCHMSFFIVLERSMSHFNISLDKITDFPIEKFVIQNKLFREESSHWLVTVPVGTRELCTVHIISHLETSAVAEVYET